MPLFGVQRKKSSRKLLYDSYLCISFKNLEKCFLRFATPAPSTNSRALVSCESETRHRQHKHEDNALARHAGSLIRRRILPALFRHSTNMSLAPLLQYEPAQMGHRGFLVRAPKCSFTLVRSQTMTTKNKIVLFLGVLCLLLTVLANGGSKAEAFLDEARGGCGPCADSADPCGFAFNGQCEGSTDCGDKTCGTRCGPGPNHRRCQYESGNCTSWSTYCANRFRRSCQYMSGGCTCYDAGYVGYCLMQNCY